MAGRIAVLSDEELGKTSDLCKSAINIYYSEYFLDRYLLKSNYIHSVRLMNVGSKAASGIRITTPGHLHVQLVVDGYVVSTEFDEKTGSILVPSLNPDQEAMVDIWTHIPTSQKDDVLSLIPKVSFDGKISSFSRHALLPADWFILKSLAYQALEQAATYFFVIAAIWASITFFRPTSKP